MKVPVACYQCHKNKQKNMSSCGNSHLRYSELVHGVAPRTRHLYKNLVKLTLNPKPNTINPKLLRSKP